MIGRCGDELYIQNNSRKKKVFLSEREALLQVVEVSLFSTINEAIWVVVWQVENRRKQILIEARCEEAASSIILN